jgi:hypothetical protein
MATVGMCAAGGAVVCAVLIGGLVYWLLLPNDNEIEVDVEDVSGCFRDLPPNDRKQVKCDFCSALSHAHTHMFPFLLRLLLSPSCSYLSYGIRRLSCACFCAFSQARADVERVCREVLGVAIASADQQTYDELMEEKKKKYACFSLFTWSQGGLGVGVSLFSC